ncbi:hypothetical protein PENSPDRAFT_68414 [Peniophora sp. CONT]|nr:hypothetical protein PENSPDRAFT_68414 [Peniophora sp. CONT]
MRLATQTPMACLPSRRPPTCAASAPQRLALLRLALLVRGHLHDRRCGQHHRPGRSSSDRFFNRQLRLAPCVLELSPLPPRWPLPPLPLCISFQIGIMSPTASDANPTAHHRLPVRLKATLLP